MLKIESTLKKNYIGQAVVVLIEDDISHEKVAVLVEETSDENAAFIAADKVYSNGDTNIGRQLETELWDNNPAEYDAEYRIFVGSLYIGRAYIKH